jgi:AcrR family transcriptional regulator
MPRSKQQFQEMREKTRENILSAALKLFAEKGFDGTSINDIAKAASISKGLAYNYFESKQKIIEAIFEELIKEGEQFVDVMNTVDDPYKKISTLIEATFKYYEENEERWKLYTAFIFQPAMFEEGKKIATYFNEKYLHILENLASSIGFKNPRLEVKILNALLDGIGLDYFFDKAMFPLSEVKEYLLKRYSKERIDKLNSLGLLD